MMETLAYRENDIDTNGNNFYLCGYAGTQSDLFRLMENLAIKNNLIRKSIKVSEAPWGLSGYNLIPNRTTNFSNEELNKIYESFIILMNRGVIAPRGLSNYGANLPSFHVTEYGLRCLEANDILPYDSDGYLKNLSKINNLDEWIKYYINQALECFNSYCYEASLIMVGLANEVLLEIVIREYLEYIKKNNLPKYSSLSNTIKSQIKISLKYKEYLNSVKKQKDVDAGLKELSKFLDNLATEVFQTYVRLTRNDLSHPNELKVDRITCLMIFISFIKYCESQYKFLNYFKSNK